MNLPMSFQTLLLCHSKAEGEESAVVRSIDAAGNKQIPQRLNAVSE
jgi:hypothetical protein